MKATAAQVLLMALAAFPLALAGEVTPVGKVLQLLSDLQSKIVSEGEAAQKEYSEFTEWCEERSKNVGFEIKTGKAEVAELQATIEDQSALSSSLSAKVEQLSADISTDEADLKAATEIRSREAADFAAEKAELSEVIDTLQRAIGLLEKEMAKTGSLVQLKNAGSIAQALSMMVQASVLSSADAGRLTALVQSSQASENSDSDMGAPASAVYKGQSGGIIETLEDLLEKAEAQLSDAGKKETTNLHNFEMLKQSLEDEIKFATKDMNEANKGIAAAKEKTAVAEGDLAMTSKELESDVNTKATLHQNCMTKAQDFEAATKSRDEELKALAAAKTAISENTGGADSLTYGLSQVSFMQRSSSRLSSSMDLAHFEAVRFVRDLARKQKDPMLAQLASRMASAVHFSSEAGQDPFAKVKGLISDMIERLESAASADASHKAYCDKELSESAQKKEEKETEISKLSTKIDQMTARSAQLKEEVAALQKALAELASSQAEMDKIRKEENTIYVKSKADMDQGLEGVKMALSVLKEYYAKEGKAHEAAEGAGTSIIGLLEVVESDFSKGLAEMTATEETAQASYVQTSKDNEIEKTTKDQDVKYKAKEAADLDKASAELSSDRSGVQSELDAVLEYLEKIKEACIAKAEPYAERKRRREAELDGLKQALEILESETVLLQRGAARRTLRGIRPHA